MYKTNNFKHVKLKRINLTIPQEYYDRFNKIASDCERSKTSVFMSFVDNFNKFLEWDNRKE
jgi:hypothetical protein